MHINEASSFELMQVPPLAQGFELQGKTVRQKNHFENSKIQSSKIINIIILASERQHYNFFHPFGLIRCLELSLFTCLFTFGKVGDLNLELKWN